MYKVVVKTRTSLVPFLTPHSRLTQCPHSSCPPCVRITHPCPVASNCAISPVGIGWGIFSHPLRLGMTMWHPWPMESGHKWLGWSLRGRSVFRSLLPFWQFAMRTTWPIAAVPRRMRHIKPNPRPGAKPGRPKPDTELPQTATDPWSKQ